MTEPLEFITTDILGLLPKMNSGMQYIVVMTEWFSELAKAIPTTKTTKTEVVKIVLEHWVNNFGTPTELLTDNGPQIISNVFTAICTQLGINTITTFEYDLLSHGLVESFH